MYENRERNSVEWPDFSKKESMMIVFETIVASEPTHGNAEEAFEHRAEIILVLKTTENGDFRNPQVSADQESSDSIQACSLDFVMNGSPQYLFETEFQQPT